ncbi:glycosyl hydrolase family 18 protein [Tissierella sp. Yu-01]|uniref:glycosyl hydrolase family 18 protein n=1 Tax=Tissierella sp. Yu-01 TaxID=3035694 RepID=UPI00240D85BD|nr:glycosyl hydrolase family 18 protein [Tissierella sp. Yu-01]WFA09864.1 glycosyl hydrolase family 18 protein [Tissierella sp. Yu-01]
MKRKILLVILVFILSVSVNLYISNKPNTDVISYSDELYLIIEDKIIEYGKPAIIKNDVIYFSFDFIKEYIDTNLFYDEVEEMVIFTSDEYVKKFKLSDNKGSINLKEYYIDYPIIRQEDVIYIPVDLIIDDYEIVVNYYNNTNAIVVDYTDMYYLQGEIILENPIIRSDLDKKAPIVSSSVNLGSIVNVYGEFENWYEIRTNDGTHGFIEKKFLKLNHTKDVYKTELVNINVDEITMDYKINLTWDYTYSKVKFTDNIKEIPGVNVISPTWFSILDVEGNIQDKGNKDYVKKYKDLGYELWPLVDNSFNPDITHKFLKSSSGRDKIISNLIDIYMDYGFDGINIDFENVYLKDKDLLTQFVRELYPIFKEEGLVVSMDVTTLSTSENWSLCYDRSRLHESLDYIMLMAYDQHWASSPIAGSVAEYTWVENGLIKVLEQVPNEKLILAVPFYTRLWIIEGSNITSKSLSMKIANDFIEDNQIIPVWNEEIGQYYGEIRKGDTEYKIWLEDENSLCYKTSLIHKYNLAGIASWRKGYETENIWESIDDYLN